MKIELIFFLIFCNRIKRQKRDTEDVGEVENRQTKRFCEDGTGM